MEIKLARINAEDVLLSHMTFSDGKNDVKSTDV